MLCRLTLTIVRPLSDDGFLTSSLRFRSTFGIFNLFSIMNSKVTTTEGFEPPIFWFEVRSLVRWTMRPGDVFANSLVLQLVTWVKSKAALGACYRLTVSVCFARNWRLLSSSPVCLVKVGQIDVAGSFSFVNHDWGLQPFFDHEMEFYDHRGFWIPNLPIWKQAPLL